MKGKQHRWMGGKSRMGRSRWEWVKGGTSKGKGNLRGHLES